MNLIDITDLEIGIVRNMMLSKSNRQIAEIMGWEVKDANDIVNQLCLSNNLTCFQEKLNNKRQERAAAKPKKESKQKIKKERPAKLSSKEKEAYLKEKEEKIKRSSYSEVMKVERQRRNLNREPRLPTRHVDYSQKISVRIDRKTTIYADPGEDIQALKERFLKTYKPVSD